MEKHEQLLALLNPVIDFMTANEFNYFIVAGKDETCTRHLRGDRQEVAGMITGMMENNPQVASLLSEVVEDFESRNISPQMELKLGHGG